jgi:formylglycine-generating enzyme required for sulfatase activity
LQVGEFSDSASPFGVLNASGNVWEWTLDWYDPDYFDSLPALIDPVVDSDQNSISGAPARVVRGGSAFFSSALASVAVQDWEYPDQPNFGIGFRCVISLSQ